MVDENELLLDAIFATNEATRNSEKTGEIASPPQGSSPDMDFHQWMIGPNDTFRPAGKTIEAVPPGVYRFKYDDHGTLFAEKMNIVSDKLIVLPDTVNDRLLAGAKKFWTSKDRYDEYGLLYKLGVILWGPPGSGKTATLQLLSRQLVDMGGIVVISISPSATRDGLKIVRRIEPNRNIITIFEDVDEMIRQHGEHELLALLDGESQISNVLNIATTNYPDQLGARIMNRPGRFDERIYVGMPTAEAREVYLRNVAKTLDESTLRKWVKDTESLSVAHLRALAASIFCLDQDYDEVIKRLRSMKIKPKEVDGFGNDASGVGFQASSRVAAGSPAVPYR